MTRVVIAGVSTRAMADSAARAGYAVTAIDGYADRDQHASVRALSLPRDLSIPYTAAAAAAASADIEADGVAYLSNFENDPDAVAMLSANRTLWGNPPEVLRRARDPFQLAEAFRSRGLPAPLLKNVPNVPNDPNDWLLKPLSSGGGHGVRVWKPNAAVPGNHYLQQRIDGTSGSILFLAAQDRVTPLGIFKQLVGDASFGSHGFRYCGSILSGPHDRQFARGDDLARTASLLADVAASAFGLRGVNGIDFVARNGVPWPIELNPRWTASVELVERAYGINLFAWHVDACNGSLPLHGLHHEAPLVRAFGKAIVFAREDVTAGSTDAWLADPDVRDVPHTGERFTAGSPVCTVFAEAADADACHAALVNRAARIYADLERWRTPIHDSPFTIHDS